MTGITEIIAEFEKQTIAEIKKFRSDILARIIFYCPCILIMSVLGAISMVCKGIANDLNVFFLLFHLLVIINMARMIRQDYDTLWELKCFPHSKYLGGSQERLYQFNVCTENLGWCNGAPPRPPGTPPLEGNSLGSVDSLVGIALPHLFPEEVLAELYALCERLARENKSILQIRLTMSMEILRLIIAFVQIKIENLWLPSGDRNKVDQ